MKTQVMTASCSWSYYIVLSALVSRTRILSQVQPSGVSKHPPQQPHTCWGHYMQSDSSDAINVQ